MRIHHGDPAWLELATDDLEEARAFYGAVFGWRLEYDESLDAVVASVDGRPVASVRSALDAEGERLLPAAWKVWLRVDDLAQATSDAVGARGHVVSPPKRGGGAGRHAVVEDPSGVEVVLWEPEGETRWALGSGHGQPCWFDVLSAGFDEVRRFYHSVAGWVYHYPRADGALDTSEPLQGEYRHAVNGGQGRATAGIVDTHEATDPVGGNRWVMYLAVNDVDETCHAASAVGGVVLEGPRDMPLGRIAGIRDPHGAEFRVLRSPVA